MAVALRKTSRYCLSVLFGPVLLLFVCGLVPAAAQPSLLPLDDPASIPVPTDLSRVQFHLLTVDVGDHVWDNFGHTALRVVDESTGTDLVFNWGLFDTSGGLLPFGWRFFRGEMRYRLGVVPTGWELSRYEREQRSVWQDRLNLTDDQKARLYRRLAWNLRDANIAYDYDYFRDNCTTRVRDYLDEALGGALSEAIGGRAGETWRDEVRQHYRSLPPVAMTLDVWLNGQVDEPMSRWQQMFLPMELREGLLRVESDVRQDDETLPLLSRGEQLLRFESPPDRGNGYHFMAGLLLPLGLLALTVRRVPLSSFGSTPGYRLAAGALTYRLLGLVGLVLGLFSGLTGLVLTVGWWMSSHEVLQANWNLLLFWPTDLFLLGAALRWLLTGRAIQTTTGWHQWIVTYLVLHGLAGLVYLFVAITGLTGQHLGSTVLYILPVLPVFAVIVALAGYRSVRPIRFG